MKLHISPVGVELPHQTFPLITKYPFDSVASMKERKRDQFVVCQIVLSSPFRSRKSFKSLNFNKQASGVHRLKRSCSANLDEGVGEHHIERFPQGFGIKGDEESEDYLTHKKWCAVNERETSTSIERGQMFSYNSFWQSHIDLLEPAMLGIRPEPPDWPERDSVLWADIEQKAKNFDLPLSLRMIKKKHQREEGSKEVGELACSSVTKAFSSMVFIIVELQTYALQMREALCNEDLELIISGVQKEMHSSFVWLFQQVFSRTPALMVSMMILLAEFGAYSTSQASLLGSLCEITQELGGSIQHCKSHNSSMASITFSDNYGVGREADLVTDGGNDESMSANPEEILKVGSQEFRSVVEVSLWNSFLETQADPSGFALDHEVLQKLFSPFSVEIEPDDYVEYSRTDLMYQMGLSQDPNDPLLLCNYAQFLYLVARDYDRAEECFKRAIQAEPPDAESLSRYADFLWVVRKDLWRAEETYLKALSIEPQNSYHASKYANFLWNTGGEETCYPLDASNNSSSRNSNM